MTDLESFQDLVARVRAGDQEAATELVRSCEVQVRRVVRVRLTEPGLRRQFDSLDICQSIMSDFFVRVALGQFELDSPEQLSKLLAEMARNRLFHHVRKQKAQRRDIRRLAVEPVENLPVAAGGETPSQIVAHEELLAMLRSRLSDDERHLAEQRAQGRTWADLAAEVGGSPDALRVRLGRALDRVANSLGLESTDGES